ncbi:tetratricopeptide repeat protein [Ramlibacter sp. PS4R-6]|uniref:tetratricopeptide repeat protein n=1 Tax=Ramlibacter sp. PS4R-6 TaxID=3133438 RepID=UPI0030B68213
MSSPPNPMEQGVALLKGGRFHEAVHVFAAVLRTMPLSPDPRVGLAQAFAGTGDGWAATAWMSDACRVAPRRAELWLELVRMLGAQQREAEVEPALVAAVSANPDDITLLQMQGQLYLRRKHYPPALKAYEHLHDLKVEEPSVLLNYGFCLEHTGAVEKSVRLYRKALALKPDFMEAQVDLSGVLWRIEDFQGALAHAQKAIELAPDNPYAVRILGTAYLNLNQLEEAEKYLRRALELQPEFSLAEIDLAFTLLLGGRLEEGWPMYARRWRDTERMVRPPFYNPQLEWQGRTAQPARGKRIAVYAEQGLGDVIQFIRYVRELQADGATVYGVIQQELVPLVEHSFPGVECLKGGKVLEADHHVALLDLPMHYGTRLESIPAGIPYLRAPQDNVQEWGQRLPPAEGRLRVGLAWSGSLRQVNNNNRAVRLSHFRPLLDMPELQCFSLQKGECGVFTDIAPGGEQLVDLTGEWNDFTDSAAMIENLDLVITVDTSIAHLAGAIGKECWVLLAPNADWRWLLEREDCPWYPTLRLFRRGFGEARAKQVERVVQALQQRLAISSL